MKEYKEKITIALFAVGLWILMLRQMSGMMAIVPYFSLLAIVYGQKMLYLGIGILGVAIGINKPHLLELVLCVWAICTVKISENTMMLILVFLILAGKELDKRLITKIWLIPVIPIVSASIILYPILKAQESIYVIDYAGRWTFFFNHPNSFGLWFTFMILGIICLCHENLPEVAIYGIIVGAVLFLFLLPQCKTSAIIFALLIPTLFLQKHCKKLWQLELWILPWGCLAVTGILTYLYYSGNVLCDHYILHKTFSMRFQDAAVAFTKYDWTILGQPITNLGQPEYLHDVFVGWVSLDNSYVAALLYYGIFGGGLLLIYILLNIYLGSVEKGNASQIWPSLFLLTFVMGMMEWPAWYGTINFLMISMGQLVVRVDHYILEKHKELKLLYDKKKPKTN